jgi:hypothetical protein
MSDSAAGGFPGSLCAHYGGSCEEAPEGVNAMIRDLFSPTVPQKLRDLQAIALLTSLSEIETINQTMRAALVYAAERLWGLLEEAEDVEDDDPDGPEGGDDGPLSLGSPGEGGKPSLSSPGPSSIPSPGSLPDRMFR